MRVAAVVGSLFAFLGTASAQATFEGRDAEAWAKQLLSGAERPWALHRLTSGSSEAVEILAELVEDPRNAIAGMDAVFALASLGPKAKSAFPALLRVFQDRNAGMRPFVVRALVATGRAKTRVLVDACRRLLDHRVLEERSLGYDLALHLGASATPLRPPLVRLLGVDGERAAKALARVGLGTVWPSELDALLKSPRQGERVVALTALGGGRHLAAAVPHLLAALEHQSIVLRRTAAETLMTLAPRSPVVEPALRRRMRDPDSGVRLRAAGALARLGKSPRALRFLISTFEVAHEARFARSFRESLGRPAGPGVPAPKIEFLPPTGAAVPKDWDEPRPAQEYYGDDVIRILVRVGEPAVKELGRALTHPSPHVRRHCALVLLKLGADGAAAAGSLISVLGDEELGNLPLLALQRMGEAAVPAIRSELRRGGRDVRTLAAATQAVGPGAVQLVARELPTVDAESRESLLWILRNVGRMARAAVPVLERALGRELDPAVRKDVQRALGFARNAE